PHRPRYGGPQLRRHLRDDLRSQLTNQFGQSVAHDATSTNSSSPGFASSRRASSRARWPFGSVTPCSQRHSVVREIRASCRRCSSVLAPLAAASRWYASLFRTVRVALLRLGGVVRVSLMTPTIAFHP